MSISPYLLIYDISSKSSCLHRASTVSKTHFIVPTDADYYKIIEMLKQFTILKLQHLRRHV